MGRRRRTRRTRRANRVGGRRRNTIRKIGGKKGSYEEYKSTYRSLKENATSNHYHLVCSVDEKISIDSKYDILQGKHNHAYADTKHIYIHLNATKTTPKETKHYNIYGTIDLPEDFAQVIANHTPTEYKLKLTRFFIKHTGYWNREKLYTHTQPISVTLTTKFKESVATAFYNKDDTYWVFTPHDSEGQFYLKGFDSARKPTTKIIHNPSRRKCAMVTYINSDSNFIPAIDPTPRAIVERFYIDEQSQMLVDVRLNTKIGELNTKIGECSLYAIVGADNNGDTKVYSYSVEMNYQRSGQYGVKQTVEVPHNFRPYNNYTGQLMQPAVISQQMNYNRAFPQRNSVIPVTDQQNMQLDPNYGHSNNRNTDTDDNVLSPTYTTQKGLEKYLGKPAVAVSKTPTTSSDISTQLKTIIDIQNQILAEIRLISQPASQPASQIDSPHSV